jgi:hypothetical protein
MVLVCYKYIRARHASHLHKGIMLHMHEHIGVEEQMHEELVPDARQQPTPATPGRK